MGRSTPGSPFPPFVVPLENTGSQHFVRGVERAEVPADGGPVVREESGLGGVIFRARTVIECVVPEFSNKEGLGRRITADGAGPSRGDVLIDVHGPDIDCRRGTGVPIQVPVLRQGDGVRMGVIGVGLRVRNGVLVELVHRRGRHGPQVVVVLIGEDPHEDGGIGVPVLEEIDDGFELGLLGGQVPCHTVIHSVGHGIIDDDVNAVGGRRL